MSVDMCSNKFSEWWQQGEHGWPIEPQCAEYALAREAFRQGWVAAQNAKELGTTPNTARDEICAMLDVALECCRDGLFDQVAKTIIAVRRKLSPVA